jgi:poly-gamma-glutamate biosynthesis protein PgsC/CapC
MPLTASIAIGLLLGFLFYEWTGFSPGGFVVPGYIALYLNQPVIVLTAVVVSMFTYGLVHSLSGWMIIYGRRRFILMVLIGFACQWIMEWSGERLLWSTVHLDVIGYIIPGLVANEIERQGLLPTLSSLSILSILVRLVLISFGLLEVW